MAGADNRTWQINMSKGGKNRVHTALRIWQNRINGKTETREREEELEITGERTNPNPQQKIFPHQIWNPAYRIYWN